MRTKTSNKKNIAVCLKNMNQEIIFVDTKEIVKKYCNIKEQLEWLLWERLYSANRLYCAGDKLYGDVVKNENFNSVKKELENLCVTKSFDDLLWEIIHDIENACGKKEYNGSTLHKICIKGVFDGIYEKRVVYSFDKWYLELYLGSFIDNYMEYYESEDAFYNNISTSMSEEEFNEMYDECKEWIGSASPRTSK